MKNWKKLKNSMKFDLLQRKDKSIREAGSPQISGASANVNITFASFASI